MPLSGESQISCATLLATTSIVDPDINFLQDPLTDDCCYKFCAFVFPTDVTDEFRNDKYHYNFRFDKDLVTSAIMELQKFVNGEWVTIANLTDDTYGTFEDYGNFVSLVTNQSYMGYIIEWSKVHGAFGIGSYRVVSIGTDILGGLPENSTLFGFNFCVEIFTDTRANGTVRLESIHNAIIGDAAKDQKVIDYTDLEFYQQFRICDESEFNYAGATLEETSNWLQNGVDQDVDRKQNPKALLTVGAAPIEVHDLILYHFFMGEVLQLTDYNNINFTRGNENWIKKQVKQEGGYVPEINGQSQKARIEDIELKVYINNHYEQLC